LDIGVLGYIGIVQHKEHSPEVFHIPPGTPCIHQPLDRHYYSKYKPHAQSHHEEKKQTVSDLY